MQIFSIILTSLVCANNGRRIGARVDAGHAAQELIEVTSPMQTVVSVLLATNPASGWHYSGLAGVRTLSNVFARNRMDSRAITVMDEAAEGSGASGRKAGRSGPVASKTQLDTNCVKGTRDFPPEEMRLQRWLFDQFRAVSQLFGYEEWDAPVLESEELYTRKAGEEITGQLYNFQDKSDRKVALRPELTPSLARLILQKGKALTLPAKWYAIGQCWRYERMTRGRRREHYQWNMDLFGVASVDAEAELLSSIVTFLQRLGLSEKDVGIKISSRKVLQEVLKQYGVEDEQFAPVAVIVDKMDKLPREKVEEELAEIGVVPEAVDGILSALSIRSLEELEKLVGSDNEAVSDLKSLFELAEGYGYKDWLVFDASVVRGLAYYTGTVFEGFDREGKLRAIFGGGRYDRLLSTFGGEDIPACGFGFGDNVIIELLKERNLLPKLGQKIDDLVVALEPSLRPAAASVAAKLRSAGRNVEVVLEDKKMKWVFKRSERNGASRLVFVGGDEWSKGAVSVKTLETGDQEEIPFADLK